MALLHFLFHHLLSCKEGIIYSQALQYNVIIPKDHILQEKLNDLTRILLARTYPLYINKNKKPLIHILSNLLYQRIRHTEPDIVPIVTPFSDISKSFTNTIHKNWHAIATDTILYNIWPSKPLSAYTKSRTIMNHLVRSTQTYGSSQQNS